MNKIDIVAYIAKETGLSRDMVQITIEEFMDVIKKHVTAGENIYLRGFGTFKIIHKADRYQNVNQGTEKLFVPAHNEPKFVPSKVFKGYFQKFNER